MTFSINAVDANAFGCTVEESAAALRTITGTINRR